MKKRSACILGALTCVGAYAAKDPVVESVKWSTFLETCDMIWTVLPTKWSNGPFLGNGEQGTVMYKRDDKTIRWDIGCSAAHDHRKPEDDDLSEKNPSILNRGRHHIGYLKLGLPQKISSTQCRLSLWDAQASGTFTSDHDGGGMVQWRTIVHATEPVIRYEITTEGEMNGATFEYVPLLAQSPRAIRSKNLRKPANEPAVVSKHPDGVMTAVQNLYAGGQTAVAWKSETNGNTTTLWLSVLHSYPDTTACDKAIAAVNEAAKSDQEKWLDKHRRWWHDYYPQSVVSLGDSYWDSFYWIQQYKRASATRDKGWIIDNQGPWLQPTAWNGTWWDLNIQLSHSGVNKANRKEMATALSYRLGLNRKNLAYNVPKPYRHDSYGIGCTSSGWDLIARIGEPGKGREPMDKRAALMTGNLLWALHNVDMEYLYWKDTQLRDDILYPLLVGAVNYYRHFLVLENDGRLHLPKTYSPEYRFAEDCSYDISLLKWAVGRLIAMTKEKKLTQETQPLLKEWQMIDKKLVPLHIDANTGIMVGRNTPFNSRHRHWSHLLAIYPLRTIQPDTEENRSLINKSLTNWEKHGANFGYAYTGRAAMAALLGDGDRAYEFLNGLKKFLQPNTMYHELGSLPVIETPLHGATVIQDMLMQCWGHTIRVFPAVPKEWSSLQFHHIRTQGAFLVSATRDQGHTRWVVVTSEAGGNVRIDTSLEKAAYRSSENTRIVVNPDGTFEMSAKPGGWVKFWAEGSTEPDAVVSSIPSRTKQYRFGLNKN